MSTSATQPGTTTTTGRSGKGLGFAAAVLAVVIAAGFVFALNQGNEAAESDASTRAAAIAAARHAEMVEQLEAAYQASTRPDGAAELDRLNDLALQVQMKTHPDSAIENIRYQLTQAGLLDSGTYVPSIVQPVEAIPERMDGNLDVVQSQLEQAGLIESTAIRNGFVVTNQGGGLWSEGNLDLIRAQAKAQQPTETDQPEWDKRMY